MYIFFYTNSLYESLEARNIGRKYIINEIISTKNSYLQNKRQIRNLNELLIKK